MGDNNVWTDEWELADWSGGGGEASDWREALPELLRTLEPSSLTSS